MTIEILYPELGNLFGDTGNVRFLKQCLPEATFVETHLSDQPAFATQDVDLIYMGPMSEQAQLLVIDALKPHLERFQQLVEQDLPMLLIGNACEVFANAIETPEGTVNGLGLLPFTAKQEMIQRFNGLTMGKFENMTLLGFRSQFTFGFGDNQDKGFIKVIRGVGLNPDAQYEGFKVHNLIATYLLGPILIINPCFTHWLFQVMGCDRPLPFEDELNKAYQIRLKEFQNPKVDF